MGYTVETIDDRSIDLPDYLPPPDGGPLSSFSSSKTRVRLGLGYLPVNSQHVFGTT